MLFQGRGVSCNELWHFSRLNWSLFMLAKGRNYLIFIQSRCSKLPMTLSLRRGIKHFSSNSKFLSTNTQEKPISRDRIWGRTEVSKGSFTCCPFIIFVLSVPWAHWFIHDIYTSVGFISDHTLFSTSCFDAAHSRTGILIPRWRSLLLRDLNISIALNPR